MLLSFLTSLLVCAACLHNGAKVEPSQGVQFSQASCLSERDSLQALERMAVKSRSMDQENVWAISEADIEEEESSDGDAEVIIPESQWNWLSHGQAGQFFWVRLDQRTFRSSARSPILRC
jgi:hypothetical protein